MTPVTGSRPERPPSSSWTARGADLRASGRPLIMGILNVTPDSFSDGGLAATVAEAIARVHAGESVSSLFDGVDPTLGPPQRKLF